MDERMLFLFKNEMSAQARPSLDGLAQEVLAQGRRARRARIAKIASAVFVAAGLVGAAIAAPATVGGHAVARDRGAVAKTASPASPASPAKPETPTASASGANADSTALILTSVNSPIKYIPQPAGPKAPTTSAAVLDELLKLLPPGATSNYAYYGLGAQTYLAGASGLGMIRIFLASGSLNPNACADAHSDATVTCSTLPSGAPVVTTRISDNCIEPLAVDVDHGDGLVVQVDVATCLAWNGQTNPPAHMAITAAQALKIAANPAWGESMDAALIRDAAHQFTDVPQGG